MRPVPMRRDMSLRLRLLILVAGTSVPLIAFSAAIIYQHYTQDQREAYARVLQNTRAIQLVLDREMQGVVSGLTVLAGSDSLARGDFTAFRGRAQGFLAQYPGHSSIVVGKRDGSQVFNSAKAPGERRVLMLGDSFVSFATMRSFTISRSIRRSRSSRPSSSSRSREMIGQFRYSTRLASTLRAFQTRKPPWGGRRPLACSP